MITIYNTYRKDRDAVDNFVLIIVDENQDYFESVSFYLIKRSSESYLKIERMKITIRLKLIKK